VIVAIGIGPWISVAIAASIAESNGCELNESEITPCVVGGEDLGETLYTMGMMGWIGIATCPIALVMLVIYLLVVIILWFARRNKAKQA
jgi:hypothetical protein